MSAFVRETLGFRLSRTARLWRARLDERLSPLGLTQAKWLVLLHLFRAGGAMPQKDLAASVGVEGPTLVRVLDGLERLGFIERRGLPGDRRAKTVHLTGQASATITDIEARAGRLREEVLAGLPEADLETLDRVLDLLLRRLDPRAGE